MYVGTRYTVRDGGADVVVRGAVARSLQRGALVEAGGAPFVVDGRAMLPVQPEGAAELQRLEVLDTQEMRGDVRGLLLSGGLADRPLLVGQRTPLGERIRRCPVWSRSHWLDGGPADREQPPDQGASSSTASASGASSREWPSVLRRLSPGDEVSVERISGCFWGRGVAQLRPHGFVDLAFLRLGEPEPRDVDSDGDEQGIGGTEQEEACAGDAVARLSDKEVVLKILRAPKLRALPAFWDGRLFEGVATLDFLQRWEEELSPFLRLGAWLTISPWSPKRFLSERAPCWPEESCRSPKFMLKVGTLLVATGRVSHICGRRFVEVRRWLRAFTQGRDLARGWVEATWLQPAAAERCAEEVARKARSVHYAIYTGARTVDFGKRILGDGTPAFDDDPRCVYTGVPEDITGSVAFSHTSEGLVGGNLVFKLNCDHRGFFYIWGEEERGGDMELRMQTEEGWEEMQTGFEIIDPDRLGGRPLRIFKRKLAWTSQREVVVYFRSPWAGGFCFVPSGSPRLDSQTWPPAVEEDWARAIRTSMDRAAATVEGVGALEFRTRRWLPTGESVERAPVWAKRSVRVPAGGGGGEEARPSPRSCLHAGVCVSGAIGFRRICGVYYVQFPFGAVECRYLEAQSVEGEEEAIAPAPGRWVEVLTEGKHQGEEAQVVETRSRRKISFWRVRLAITGKLKWFDRVRDASGGPPEQRLIARPLASVPLALKGNSVEILLGRHAGARGVVVGHALDDQHRPREHLVELQNVGKDAAGAVQRTWTSHIRNMSYDAEALREARREERCDQAWQAQLDQELERAWRSAQPRRCFFGCYAWVRACRRSVVEEREVPQRGDFILHYLKPGAEALVLEASESTGRWRLKLRLEDHNENVIEGWIDLIEAGEPAVVLVEQGGTEDVIERHLLEERERWHRTFKRRWLRSRFAKHFAPERQAQRKRARPIMERREGEKSAARVLQAHEDTLAARGCPPGGPRPGVGLCPPLPAGIEEAQLYEAVVWVLLLPKARRYYNLVRQERRYAREYRELGLPIPESIADAENSSGDDAPEPYAVGVRKLQQFDGPLPEYCKRSNNAKLLKVVCNGSYHEASAREMLDQQHFFVVNHLSQALWTSGRFVE